MKMYNKNRYWGVITLFLGLILQARSDDSIDTNVQIQVNQLPTVESKIEYLSSLVAAEQDSSSITSNIRKSSAIILLGQIGGTNVIDILITNLIYIDKRYNGSPASHALILIGEPVVPQLLDVLRNSDDEAKVRRAATTIGFIESRNWKKFSEQQKNILPKKAWDRLIRYAIIVS